MRDVFAAIGEWLAADIPCAIATLVEVRDAAPAPLGSSMTVRAGGAIVGDIGAGCYESEIVAAAMATVLDGIVRDLPIDLADDDPLAAGSGCGGWLRVVTWRPPASFASIAKAIVAGGDDVAFDVAYGSGDSRRTHTVRIAARRDMFIVGGTNLANEIVAIAKRLDYRTIVVDPRPAFATPTRLQNADEVVVAWPDEILPARLNGRSPLLIISHDPKIDLPSLRAGLESDAPFIGLLGSRRAQTARRATLHVDGYAADALARIHGPVGLDLGGATMAETAIAIVSEVVATAHCRTGIPLGLRVDAIHEGSQSSLGRGRGRV